jgi:phage FluMu protein Com
MTYVHVYECVTCGKTLKRRRNTARLRFACQECEQVQTFDRQRRITETEQHQ